MIDFLESSTVKFWTTFLTTVGGFALWYWKALVREQMELHQIRFNNTFEKIPSLVTELHEKIENLCDAMDRLDRVERRNATTERREALESYSEAFTDFLIFYSKNKLYFHGKIIRKLDELIMLVGEVSDDRESNMTPKRDLLFMPSIARISVVRLKTRRAKTAIENDFRKMMGIER